MPPVGLSHAPGRVPILTINITGKISHLKLCPTHEHLITTAEPLNTYFANRWCQLPTELKVHILSFILVVPETIHYEKLHLGNLKTSPGFKYWDKPAETPGHVYYKLLHTIPEIAALWREIFYQQNTFLILMNRSFYYPRGGCQLIRKVDIAVYAHRGDNFDSDKVHEPRLMTVLRKFLLGGNKLENLQHLNIKFEDNEVCRLRELWPHCKPMDFPYEGGVHYFKQKWGPDMLNEVSVSYAGELQRIFTFKGRRCFPLAGPPPCWSLGKELDARGQIFYIAKLIVEFVLYGQYLLYFSLFHTDKEHSLSRCFFQ